MDCSPPASSVHGILQAKYWSELSHPPPGDLPDPGVTPTSPGSPALILYPDYPLYQVGFVPLAPSGKPKFIADAIKRPRGGAASQWG